MVRKFHSTFTVVIDSPNEVDEVNIALTNKLTFGSSGNAEVAGFLYDKENGTITWRDKGIGRAGQGGLIGMAMKSAMDEEAISVAMGNLLASIPERSE